MIWSKQSVLFCKRYVRTDKCVDMIGAITQKYEVSKRPGASRSLISRSDNPRPKYQTIFPIYKSSLQWFCFATWEHKTYLAMTRKRFS